VGVRRLCARLSHHGASFAAGGLLRVSEEVREALASGRPVVALESTIISHGMPYPSNAETAKMVEGIVRQGGAVPATVFLMDGMIHVGATEASIERLAQEGSRVRKCSRRDVAMALARGEMGATTVASTMLAAHAAGIEVFVTGGIGGVHRGVQDTWGEWLLRGCSYSCAMGVCADVSADLTELGRTPVTVVCGGVKSILDIPKTLEVLETLGVPVFSLGQTRFPAFYTRDAGVDAPDSVGSVEELAKGIHVARRLGLDHGFVLGVPNPEPADAAVVERAIEGALEDAKAAGIHGRDTTPFLLKRVMEATQGKSLETNVTLIKHNASVGAELARAVARHKHALPHPPKGGGQQPRLSRVVPSAGSWTPHRSLSGGRVWPRTGGMFPPPNAELRSPLPLAEGAVVAIGSCLVDVIARPKEKLVEGTSNPGSIVMRMGGVTRNIAEGIARLGGKVALGSSVGQDSLGDSAKASCSSLGVDVIEPFQVEGEATPSYAAMLDNHGELTSAVADATAIDRITSAQIQSRIQTALGNSPCSVLVMDCGLAEEAIIAGCTFATAQAVAGEGHRRGRRLEFDPVALARDAGFDPEALQGMAESGELSPEERKQVEAALAEVRAVLEDPVTKLPADATPEQVEEAMARARAEKQLGYGGDDGDAHESDDAAEFPVWTSRGIPVVLEPVSVSKARKAGQPGVLAQVALLKPNAAEVHSIAEAFQAAAKDTPLGIIRPPSTQAFSHRGADGHLRWQSPDAVLQELDSADAARKGGDVEGVERSLERLLTPGGDVPEVGEDMLEMARKMGVGEMSMDDLRALGVITKDAEQEFAKLGLSDGDMEEALDAFKRAMRGEPLGEEWEGSDGEGEEEGDFDQMNTDHALLHGRSAAVLPEHVSPELLGACQVVLAGMCNPAVEHSGVGLIEGKKHLLVSLGEVGVLWLSRAPAESVDELVSMVQSDLFSASLASDIEVKLIHAPLAQASEVVNVTGAGDSMVSGVVSALQAGWKMEHAIYWGMAASYLSIRASPAISPEMSNAHAVTAALRAVCELNAEADSSAQPLLEALSSPRV
jgi:pseudouridine-5'-phosphate glycosidase/sugar/nucleoside kinase (ribokinase family)